MASSITISVIGDTRSLVSGVGAAEGRLGKLGGAAGRAGKLIGTGLAVGVAGVAAATAGFIGASVKSLARIERIGAQTDSVIRSTGGAAGVTREHVDKLAGSLEGLTATEAESITEGANMLLTFTNIRNGAGKTDKVFDDAVGTITDMSRALDKTGGANIDTSKTAVQLGKALNDPVKGITALSKVGVSFTEGQRKQIEGFVAAGDTMSAQKVILAELKKEFGGAGAAFGGTTVGQVELAKHALGTFGESVSAGLMPVLGKLATAATKGLTWLDTKAPAIRAFAGGILEDLQPALSFIGGALDEVRGFVESLASSTGGTGETFATFAAVARTAGESFVANVLPAIASVVGYLRDKLTPIFVTVVGIIRDQVVPTVAAFYTFLYTKLLPVIVSVATSVGAKLKPILDQLFRTIESSVLPAVQKIIAKFEEWRPAIQRAIIIVAKIIGKVLELAAAILAKVLPPVIRFAGFLLTKVVPAVLRVIGVVGSIIGFLARLAGGVASAIGTVNRFGATLDRLVAAGLAKVLSAVRELPGKISALGGKLLEAGRNIIGKFVEGLRGAGGLVSDIAGNIWDAVRGMLNDAINKLNNLLEFEIDIPGPNININPPDIGNLRTIAGKESARVFNAVSRGLLNSLGDGGIPRYLKNLDAKIAAAYKRRTGKTITPAQVKAYSRAYADEVKALTRASEAYAKTKKAREDFLANVKSQALATANVTSVGQVGAAGEQTADSIVQGLRDRLNAIKNFQDQIRKLSKAGLNKDLLAQIVAAGVEGGTATAEALVAGIGTDAIASANYAQAQITKAAGQLAGTATNAVLAPLDPSRVQAAAKRAGDVIAAVLRRQLGIRIDVNTNGSRRTTVAARTRVAPTTNSTGAGSGRVERIVLTAEQLSAVERGKRVTADLRAYRRAGGQLP